MAILYMYPVIQELALFLMRLAARGWEANSCGESMKHCRQEVPGSLSERVTHPKPGHSIMEEAQLAILP
jgi:hypothetical protein